MTARKPQPYPRIESPGSKEDGCLDVTRLVPHRRKIPPEQLKQLIREAIEKANRKSSRQSFAIPPQADEAALVEIYRKAGEDLFRYFKRYCGDPASTAHQIHNKHYRDVGLEQFRNRVVQKGRMNSGWRYQFLLESCANHSGRFKSVSSLGLSEADFNAVIDFKEPQPALNLYVSVKNRKNTMGGQDWPKAIQALENVAVHDRNRTGPYCCVFGIAMDRGQRYIKIERRTGRPYSVNSEVWLSDFLWPFFANYSYEEIMTAVLEVLLDTEEADTLLFQIGVPEEILESFGRACRQRGLINESGIFDDPYKLVKFFCE